MTFARKTLGAYGEELAKEYLKKKGYELVGQNIRLFCGEIDLLMRHRQDLVIVEVKTKSSGDFGIAADMITYKKKRKLLQLAKALWQKYPRRNVRIDVIAIDSEKINHFIAAVGEE